MAFGSWFKNIIKGAKNIIGKALPVVKKGSEIISKIAPTIANAFGGKAGDVINKVGNISGQLNQRLNVKGGANALLGGNAGKRKLLLNTEQYPFLEDY